MIEAAIFDMGGVLIKSRPNVVRDDLQNELGLDIGAIDSIWRELIPLLGSGLVDEEEFWRIISRDYKIRKVDVSENLLGRAFIEALEYNEELLEYIKVLGKSGLKLAILSNTIEPHAKPTRDRGLFDSFGYVFLSHEVGLRKPATAFYRNAVRTMAVMPEKTVFVDDDPVNVRSAQQIGLRGIIAEDPRQVIEELKALVE